MGLWRVQHEGRHEPTEAGMLPGPGLLAMAAEGGPRATPRWTILLAGSKLWGDLRGGQI